MVELTETVCSFSEDYDTLRCYSCWSAFSAASSTFRPWRPVYMKCAYLVAGAAFRSTKRRTDFT